MDVAGDGDPPAAQESTENHGRVLTSRPSLWRASVSFSASPMDRSSDGSIDSIDRIRSFTAV